MRGLFGITTCRRDLVVRWMRGDTLPPQPHTEPLTAAAPSRKPTRASPSVSFTGAHTHTHIHCRKNILLTEEGGGAILAIKDLKGGVT